MRQPKIHSTYAQGNMRGTERLALLLKNAHRQGLTRLLPELRPAVVSSHVRYTPSGPVSFLGEVVMMAVMTLSVRVVIL